MSEDGFNHRELAALVGAAATGDRAVVQDVVDYATAWGAQIDAEADAKKWGPWRIGEPSADITAVWTILPGRTVHAVYRRRCEWGPLGWEPKWRWVPAVSPEVPDFDSHD